MDQSPDEVELDEENNNGVPSVCTGLSSAPAIVPPTA
jgi:hypothetical protein